jgi:hypothetical protein
MDFTPLLKYGPWGVAAFVVLGLAYLAFSHGLTVNIKMGGKPEPARRR